MQIGQHKVVGIVTQHVLNIANNCVDFEKHNLCEQCQSLYPKNIRRCFQCKGSLKTQRTNYVRCNQCRVRLYIDSYYVSRKGKTRSRRYTCISCALRYGLITQSELMLFFQKHDFKIWLCYLDLSLTFPYSIFFCYDDRHAV